MPDVRRSLVTALFLLSSLSCGWARAELDDANKNAVRVLANEASDDYEAGRYDQALDKFSRAYAVARVPKLALWLADTQTKLGHLVAAQELCREAIALERNDLWLGNTQQQAQREAERLLDELLPRIARVAVRIEGAAPKDVSVWIDGVAVPSSLLGIERLTDPGEHRITGRNGQVSAEEVLNVSEGQRAEVVLKLARPPAPSPENTVVTRAVTRAPQTQIKSTNVGSLEPSAAPASRSALRTLGWMGVSLGAAGLAVGAGAGIATAIEHGKLEHRCPNNRCERPQWSELDTYRSVRTLSALGFVVGALGALGGVTLLMLPASRREAPTLALWLAPSGAGLSGGF